MSSIDECSCDECETIRELESSHAILEMELAARDETIRQAFAMVCDVVDRCAMARQALDDDQLFIARGLLGAAMATGGMAEEPKAGGAG